MEFKQDLGELHSTLSIPSYEASYSIGIQYIKDWFLSKFPQDFFKAFHVVGKNVLEDYNNFNINDILIKETPKAALAIQLDYDHDRDSIDAYQFGIEHYVNRSQLTKSFFVDSTNNIYLALYLEEMLMRGTFRVKLSERAQQIRLFKYMQMAFRIKSTQTNYIDVDFHIPYSLLIQLAQDMNFELKDDEVIDKIGFLAYLNRHSQIPVLMKYRNMTGRVEYFLRMREMYSHITVPDNISPDDGDRNGQTDSGFMLEMTVEFKMPVPKFYAYYSSKEPTKVDPTNTIHNNNVSLDLCTIVIPTIPEHNNKGWELVIRTDCQEDNLDGPLVLDLTQLFNGSDILKIIQYNNTMLISSDIFLDMVIYNNGKKIDFVIDWKDLKITSTHKMISYISHMFIYIDMNYMNNQLININKYYNNRIETN